VPPNCPFTIIKVAALHAAARRLAPILDLRLPDVDGKAVWEWITRHRPVLADRVVFMTGDTLSPGSHRFLEAAGRPILPKPVAMEELNRMVDTVLESHAGEIAGSLR